MIRFTLTGGIAETQGRTLVGFGLSRANVDRMIVGEPIVLRGATVGMPDRDFVLFFLEHENQVEDALAKLGLALPEDPDAIRIDPEVGG